MTPKLTRLVINARLTRRACCSLKIITVMVLFSIVTNSTQHKIGRFMLTCCLLLIANLAGIRAQTNGEYNFRQQSTLDGDSYAGDPVPILTMDCLAANGYGQWTLSSTANGSHESWPHWSYYGRNNIYVTSPSSDDQPIIQAPGTSIAVGSLDGNYFGGLDPTSDPTNFTSDVGSGWTDWNHAVDGSEVDAINITYNAKFDSIGKGGVKTVPFDYIHDDDGTGAVDCGGGTGYDNRKKGHSQSIQDADTNSASCGMLYNKALSYSNNLAKQMEYDTAKKFIEQCPHDRYASQAFRMIIEGEAPLERTQPDIRANTLVWLKSVLYLNTTDSAYFCQCLEAIQGVLPLPPDTSEAVGSTDMNIGLAVMRWMILNTTCETPALWEEYEGTRLSQREHWLNDTNAYKLDTTLPSMADLGLDTLLARHFQLSVGASGPDNFASIMPSFSVTDNPFEKQTTLRFTLNQAAYIRIEVFDQLGREVFGDGTGRVLDPGSHETPVDGRNFAPGTYYLRISLGTGEVRTIKLIKE